jgi:hypothetical protein
MTLSCKVIMTSLCGFRPSEIACDRLVQNGHNFVNNSSMVTIGKALVNIFPVVVSMFKLA